MKRKNTSRLSVDPTKLKEARGEKKQAEAAKYAGVTPQHISRIENGWVKPSSDLLARLCTFYGVDLRSLTAAQR